MNAFSFLSLRLLLSATALGFLVFFGVALRSQGQTSNFDDMDDDGWTHYDPINQAGLGPQNTWTFPNGGYRLQAAATPSAAAGPGRVASIRDDITYTDFYLTVDIVNWNTNYTQAMGILARVSEAGPGTTDGYVFAIVTGPSPFVQIARIANESTRGITGGGPESFALDPNQDYRLEFTGKQSSFHARIFLLSDLSAPVMTLEGTDPNYTSGKAGLVGFNLNSATAEPVDATFDNYLGLDHEPPHLKPEVNSLGELIISWPNDIPDYSLQSTPSFPAVEWTDITTVFNTGSRWEYITEPAGPALFYRLIRQ